GMDRYEARKAIVADLEAGGYLVKVEDYSHNVGTCRRPPTKRKAGTREARGNGIFEIKYLYSDYNSF
ncbi:MAG: hypothetical protein IIX09_00475, partial [Clostridia bacterium]|nr:hypothetical protein [Clostridia bacterium]